MPKGKHETEDDFAKRLVKEGHALTAKQVKEFKGRGHKVKDLSATPITMVTGSDDPGPPLPMGRGRFDKPPRLR